MPEMKHDDPLDLPALPNVAGALSARCRRRSDMLRRLGARSWLVRRRPRPARRPVPVGRRAFPDVQLRGVVQLWGLGRAVVQRAQLPAVADQGRHQAAVPGELPEPVTAWAFDMCDLTPYGLR